MISQISTLQVYVLPSQRNHGEDIGDSVKDIAQWVCMRGLADKMAIPR